MTILSGHTTPETAYVVNDYPYGFRLRCKIRYWLEYKKGKGFRLVSQTTDPKTTAYERWNKPKASTYLELAAVMYLDEENHVQWKGLSEYDAQTEKMKPALEEYGHTLPEEARKTLERLIIIATRYDQLQETGMAYQLAFRQAQLEYYQGKLDSGGQLFAS